MCRRAASASHLGRPASRCTASHLQVFWRNGRVVQSLPSLWDNLRVVERMQNPATNDSARRISVGSRLGVVRGTLLLPLRDCQPVRLEWPKEHAYTAPASRILAVCPGRRLVAAFVTRVEARIGSDNASGSFDSTKAKPRNKGPAPRVSGGGPTPCVEGGIDRQSAAQHLRRTQTPLIQRVQMT